MFSIFALVILAASIPTGVAAQQTEKKVNLLEPSFLPEGTTRPTLTQYLSGAFNRGLQLAGILAVVMLAFAGAEYVSSSVNPGAKEDAKKRIRNTITGLLLALAGYLILRIINPNLVTFKEGFVERIQLQRTVPTSLGTGSNFGSASTVTGDVAADLRPSAAGASIRGDIGALRTASAASVASRTSTEQEMRARFAALGDKVRLNAAEFPGLQVAGLPVSILGDLENLATACGCNLSINGGSETAGHRTHGPGKAVVDIRTTDNPAIRRYVTQNGTRCGTSLRGDPYYCIGADRFLDERNPPHIHAEFK